MSMSYCHKHDRQYDTDHEVECAECIQELANALDLINEASVELITHETVGTAWHIMRNRWCIAQWVEEPVTAFPHWNIWSTHGDFMVAMEGAMNHARQGGKWAVVVAEEV